MTDGTNKTGTVTEEDSGIFSMNMGLKNLSDSFPGQGKVCTWVNKRRQGWRGVVIKLK